MTHRIRIDDEVQRALEIRKTEHERLGANAYNWQNAVLRRELGLEDEQRRTRCAVARVEKAQAGRWPEILTCGGTLTWHGERASVSCDACTAIDREETEHERFLLEDAHGRMLRDELAAAQDR